MAERELFVVCSNCGSEVSPYVTECPYCGNRLRKRAPDLKKQKKAEEREERKAAKKRERLRRQYEGGGGDPYGTGASTGSWLGVETRPYATLSLVAASVIVSILFMSDFTKVTPWIVDNLMFVGDLGSRPWTLLTSPFLHLSAGYAFVCLFVFAGFGTGIERRFGWLAAALVWFFCGALGMVTKALLDPDRPALGSLGCAAGALVAWTIYVANREDLRDYDALGLAAVAFVICALPLATSASVFVLLGGMIGGVIAGGILMQLKPRN